MMSENLRDASVHIGIKAIIPNDDGRIFMMQRREPFAPGEPPRWDTPGGRLEPDDATPVAALTREVMEETGLPIVTEGPNAPTPADIFLIERPDGLKVVRITILARFACMGKPGRLRLSGEHRRSGFFTRAELGAMPVDDGFRQALGKEVVRAALAHPERSFAAVRRDVAVDFLALANARNIRDEETDSGSRPH